MILRSFIHSKANVSLKNIVLSTTFGQPLLPQKQQYITFLSKTPFSSSSSSSSITAFFSTLTRHQTKRYHYKINGSTSFKRKYHSEKNISVIGNKNEISQVLNKNNDNKSKMLFLSISGMSGSLLLFWYYYQHDINFRHHILALHRVSVAAMIGLKVAIQYQWMLLTCQYNQYDDEMKDIKKRECHLKSAKLVLDGLQQLGGVYVKLGQHISAMAYVLPLEWTSTLSALQDRCDPTPPNDLKALFFEDYGSTIDEVFDYFDWKPLGVASLAQVHKAHLKKNIIHDVDLDDDLDDGWVAIKIQHPRLDEFCQMDMNTVASIIGMIKWWFPDFGFEWVLQEMQESLPQELNFVNEANNAHKVMENFENDPSTALVIPKIIWAQRRILCMEYIRGARIDDLDYLKQHNIDPVQVSKEITIIFSKMIFLHGFVHCDPHPGNLLIRPKKKNKKNGKRQSRNHYNFDIVLLDHGIYRTLTDELRNDYSNLWISLIKGDEKGIEYYAYKVGCKPPHHRLFASLLTGREWHTIEAANLSSTRTLTETSRVSGKTKLFLVKIADVLSALPRMMLALLKTSDLLRHLDETLRLSASSTSSTSYRTYAIMVEYCAQAVWSDTKKKLLDSWSWSSWFSWCKKYINAWLSFHFIEYYSWFYQ